MNDKNQMTTNETKDQKADDKPDKQVAATEVNLDRIDKILKLAAKLIPAFGIVLVFGYCSSINFYPSGLTIGDTLLFVFAIIGFGVVYGFVLGASIYCAANIYGLISRALSTEAWSTLISAVRKLEFFLVLRKIGTFFLTIGAILISGAFLLFFCLIISHFDYNWATLSLFGLFTIGFCIWIIAVKWRTAFKDSPWMALLLVTLLTFSPLVMVHGMANVMVITAMQKAGVRVERALVEMPQSEYARVLATANRASVRVPHCRKLSKDRCVLRTDVLFQGVGQYAQLRFPVGGAPKNENGSTKDPEVFITIQQTDIKLSTINPFTFGDEIDSDATFGFDSATLTEAGRTKLDEIAKQVENYRILNLEVTGHTDRLGSDRHNLELSQLRAQAVADYLAKRIADVPASAIRAHGVGASAPRRDQASCPGREPSEALRRCLADDRYVEVDIVAAERPHMRKD